MLYPWNKSPQIDTCTRVYYEYFWKNSFTFIILSSCGFDETVTRIKGPHHFWGFMCPLRDLGPCKVIIFLWNYYDNLYRVAKYIHRAKPWNLEKRLNCNNWADKLNRTYWQGYLESTTYICCCWKCWCICQKIKKKNNLGGILLYFQLTSKVHYVLSLLL